MLIAQRSTRARKPMIRRVLFWLFMASIVLLVASFIATASGQGGLIGAYRPVKGKALSEAELKRVDSRLGVGNPATEFIGWSIESLKGNFGVKSLAFFVACGLLGIAWVITFAVASRRGGPR